MRGKNDKMRWVFKSYRQRNYLMGKEEKDIVRQWLEGTIKTFLSNKTFRAQDLLFFAVVKIALTSVEVAF